MSDAPSPGQARSSADAEMTSVMFAQLVMQQSNMALLFLGKTPHPQTGKTGVDLDHARFFIDQLEMLEVKTRGNLDSHEQSLLKQTLTTLRLAFVEAASKPQAQPAAAEKAASAPAAAPEPELPKAAETATPAAESAAQTESHKKFTKKY